MTTTYSDKLRLAIQGTGDNPSTWGVVANDQVFELIEDAVAGYLTLNITGGSDITLTTGNGTSDEARMAMIELQGTLTSSIDIIIPTVTKQYTVYGNFTSNAYKPTIRTNSGTGVEFTSGKKAIIFCDGTSVHDVIPDLGNLAFLDTITSSGLLDAGVINVSAISTSIVNQLSVETSATLPDLLWGSDQSDGGKSKAFPVSAINNLVSIPYATTSTNGLVRIATTAEAQTGTDTSTVITPATQKAAMGWSNFFQSTTLAVSLLTGVCVDHGLGGTPRFANGYIICQTSDLGYVPGDCVPFDLDYSADGRGFALFFNNTGVGFGVGTAPVLTGRAGSGGGVMTPSRWGAVLTAFR